MYGIHPDYWSDALIDALPELRAGYLALLHEWEGESPGGHIVYGDLLNPLLIKLLQDVPQNRDELACIFRALDQLALQGDAYLKNVLGATVFEQLAGKGLLLKAREFLSPALAQIASPMY
jgi:hypothetical protein